ncbi:hypothetical protein A3F66_03215 [candidate division TM6 bacterium RIFCSPHIGHO2_12_FULL_32_22]|nr:MAG: hypothetical protein A3F66_03215 [candidate division TM6 bacterium RIFCSPHIGHO2_12_FULL_32_22]
MKKIITNILIFSLFVPQINAVKEITIKSNSAKSSGTNTGAVAGGVAGGLVGAAIVVGLVIYFVAKRLANKELAQLNEQIYKLQLQRPSSAAGKQAQQHLMDTLTNRRNELIARLKAFNEKLNSGDVDQLMTAIQEELKSNPNVQKSAEQILKNTFNMHGFDVVDLNKITLGKIAEQMKLKTFSDLEYLLTNITKDKAFASNVIKRLLDSGPLNKAIADNLAQDLIAKALRDEGEIDTLRMGREFEYTNQEVYEAFGKIKSQYDQLKDVVRRIIISGYAGKIQVTDKNIETYIKDTLFKGRSYEYNNISDAIKDYYSLGGILAPGEPEPITAGPVAHGVEEPEPRPIESALVPVAHGAEYPEEILRFTGDL